MQQVEPHRDPAPSRWNYRYQRLMLTPLFRLALRVVVPMVIAMGAMGIWLADQDRRDSITLAIADLRSSIQDRPEFMVNAMAIDGASETIAQDIREIIPIDFPISSFDLDLEDIREQVAGLSPVAEASVRIRPGGVLQVEVSERIPVLLWRTTEGLMLVDREGFVVSELEDRQRAEGLPIMAGEGADAHVAEALALFAAADPLSDRLRGLVRVGERRWNVVLDRDQQILLPETGAVQALERVIALEQAQDILARDLVSIDMRRASRPTIRIAERAVQEWWRIRQISLGKTQE